MNYQETVRAHYFHEVERRRELNASLSIPLGVLTALLAAIAAMLSALSIPLDPIEWLVLLPAALGAATAALSVYYAMRSYLGYTYRHPTSMGTLKDWRDEALGNGIPESRVEEDIARIMSDQYAAGAERNARNNDTKSAYLHNAGVALTICLVLVILAGLPYTYLRMTAGPGEPRAAGAAVSKQPFGVLCEQRPRAQVPPSPSSAPSAATDAGHKRERGSAPPRVVSQ